MMATFFNIVGIVASISVVVYGAISIVFRLVKDHQALVGLKADVKNLEGRTYRDYWEFNGRIDALEQQGKNDGKVKAKG